MPTEVIAMRDQLNRRLHRRGWRFREVGETLRGRPPEWPPQLELVVDPGDAERLPSLGILVDLAAMPLGGERFRDILNADRDEIFDGYGSFRVRQLRHDGTGGPEIGHRAFVHGYGVGSGLSRQARLAIFDRCPSERGPALVERCLDDVGRMLEAGNLLARLLQRLYQRTVLTKHLSSPDLPDTVGLRMAATETIGTGALAPILEPNYPWRR